MDELELNQAGSGGGKTRSFSMPLLCFQELPEDQHIIKSQTDVTGSHLQRTSKNTSPWVGLQLELPVSPVGSHSGFTPKPSKLPTPGALRICPDPLCSSPPPPPPPPHSQTFSNPSMHSLIQTQYINPVLSFLACDLCQVAQCLNKVEISAQQQQGCRQHHLLATHPLSVLRPALQRDAMPLLHARPLRRADAVATIPLEQALRRGSRGEPLGCRLTPFQLCPRLHPRRGR